MIESHFSKDLLEWFDHAGRKNLPWQTPIDPYRVWVSEIMLQQTQVATVIPYFERFMSRFDNLQSLACAHVDEVLAHWAGLGYYSRGRNLHRAAQLMQDEHEGKVPNTMDALIALPGIGRSTAAAILAQSFGMQTAILDGNVKRVLTRLYAIMEWPGERETEKQLWGKAENLMPAERCRDYTQAIMDLGATLCTRAKPDCSRCPCARYCKSYAQGLTSELPKRKPKKVVPTQSRTLLLIENQNRFWLDKRPPAGIWGGLFSLPEFASKEDATAFAERYFTTCELIDELQFTHTFSHYKLKAQVLHFKESGETTKSKILPKVSETAGIWIEKMSDTEASKLPALPAPIKKLLLSLSENPAAAKLL